MEKLFNKEWYNIIKQIPFVYVNDNYREAIGIMFRISSDAPIMGEALVDRSKLAAMASWYIKGDVTDLSIVNYFAEYEFRLTNGRLVSNYGWHMYTKEGLRKCAEKLINDYLSRQAIWFIADNENIHGDTKDKLCTNSIQFLIRGNGLHMVVQMRSSDMLALLPYDMEMFKLFYRSMKAMLKAVYPELTNGPITMQIGSLHFYTSYYEHLTQSLNK